MNQELHYAELPNGETLCYVEKGEGFPILVIHGNYGSIFGMLDFLDEAPKGYRTIIPDLRGFGRSTYNHPISTIKELSDDLILFCRKIGVKEAVVVGHSLGGAVAMQFAADARDITKKLILIAPSSVYGYPLFKKGPDGGFLPFKDMNDMMTADDDTARAIAMTVNVLKSQNFDLYVKILGGLGAHEGEPTEFFKEFVREALMQKDLLADDWALTTWNITDKPSLYGMGTNQAKDIDMPTLLFTAGNDAFVLPFMSRANIDALSGNPQFQHIHYKDCTHMIYSANECDQKERFFKDYRSYIETGKPASKSDSFQF